MFNLIRHHLSKADALCFKHRNWTCNYSLTQLRRSGHDCGNGCCCAATVCWKCHKTISKCAFFCTHPGCNAIQKVNTADDKCNYFELLNMKPSFHINQALMERNMKELQKLLHPDKFATKSLVEQDASSSSSSALNQAYQILSSPMDRTAYLLSLRGIDVLEENNSSNSDNNVDDKWLKNIMMETYLLREQIEECTDPQTYSDLYVSLQQQMNDTGEELEQAWRQEDRPALTQAAIRMKYLSKGMEELMNKDQCK